MYIFYSCPRTTWRLLSYVANFHGFPVMPPQFGMCVGPCSGVKLIAVCVFVLEFFENYG